jgi:hypothetical protein
MSTTGSIGYLDQNGNYRATFVGSDAYPEDVHEAIGDLLTEMNAEEFIQWVETGIAGGGYDGLYNHETMEERDESDGPCLIDAENYDQSGLYYTYVVTGEKRIEFFDPKNVMEYDAEDDDDDYDGDDLES